MWIWKLNVRNLSLARVPVFITTTDHERPHFCMALVTQTFNPGRISYDGGERLLRGNTTTVPLRTY